MDMVNSAQLPRLIRTQRSCRRLNELDRPEVRGAIVISLRLNNFIAGPREHAREL